MAPWLGKSLATAVGLILNFSARRFIVFSEPGNPDWAPQRTFVDRKEPDAS
jgi:hypothetical protein